MRRVAVVASASGNGKTTVGRALAEHLGVPFVERFVADADRADSSEPVAERRAGAEH